MKTIFFVKICEKNKSLAVAKVMTVKANKDFEADEVVSQHRDLQSSKK